MILMMCLNFTMKQVLLITSFLETATIIYLTTPSHASVVALLVCLLHASDNPSSTSTYSSLASLMCLPSDVNLPQEKTVKTRRIQNLNSSSWCHKTWLQKHDLIELKELLLRRLARENFTYRVYHFSCEECLIIALNFRSSGIPCNQLAATYGGNWSKHDYPVTFFSSFVCHNFYHLLCGQCFQNFGALLTCTGNLSGNSCVLTRMGTKISWWVMSTSTPSAGLIACNIGCTELEQDWLITLATTGMTSMNFSVHSAHSMERAMEWRPS